MDSDRLQVFDVTVRVSARPRDLFGRVAEARVLASTLLLGLAGCPQAPLGVCAENGTCLPSDASAANGSSYDAGYTSTTPTPTTDASASAPPAADSSAVTTASVDASDGGSGEGGDGAEAGAGTDDGSAEAGARPPPDGGLAEDAEVAEDGGAVASGSGPVTDACETWGPFEAPEEIHGLGLDGDLWAPSLSADGKTLYLAMAIDSQEHIFSATRTDDGTTFSLAAAVDSVNSSSNDGTPFLSFDGLTLYFYSTRPGGIGDRDIWFAQRDTPESDFAPAALLASVNSSSMDHLPWVSRDNLTLLFSSTRPGGDNSPAEIFMATRAGPDGAFSPPVLLPGMAVNSPASENELLIQDRAVMTRDGLTLYFASNRGNTTNDFDLWTATRADTNSPFANATSLSALKSPDKDINVSLSWDESELFFSSDRDGGTQTIWRSVRHCL